MRKSVLYDCSSTPTVEDRFYLTDGEFLLIETVISQLFLMDMRGVQTILKDQEHRTYLTSTLNLIFCVLYTTQTFIKF